MTEAPSRSKAPLHLKVFLSSPGDVANERLVAQEILEHLQFNPLVRGELTVQIVAWDRFEAGVPMRANMTPQEAINRGMPRPSECEIVVVILWTRLGTPLPVEFRKPDGGRYLSGTEWEYRDALRGDRESDHRPEVLVYRRTEAPTFRPGEGDFEEKREQWLRVEQLFEAMKSPDGSLRGGYNKYSAPDEFRELLERDVKVVVKTLLDKRRSDEMAVSSPSTLELWPGSPFPGLRPFGPDDAPIFFGQGRAIDELVRRVSDPQTRFVAVVGASGSGKSSLVSAGLRPRLEQGAVEGSQDWPWLRCVPARLGGDPFLSLAAELDRLAERPRQRPAEVARRLFESADGWAGVVEEVLAGRPEWARLILFVDQFEELFTHSDADRVGPFIELLAAAERHPRTLPILTLRADFYPRCLERAEFTDLLRPATFPVSAPNAEALLEMIERPAHRAGLQLEEGLAGLIVEDTGRGAGRLPLMAFALAELYDTKREDGTLTHQAYERFGGVGGAISRRAENVFGALPEATRDALPRVFRELVVVDEPPTVTRRRAALEPLQSAPEAAALVAELVEARLLVTGEGRGGSTLEITHEALLDGWPRLSRWIDECRDDLYLRRRLSGAAADWQRSGRRRTFLWSDERVVEARQMLDRLEPLLSEAEREFLGPIEEQEMSALLADRETGHELRATIGARMALLGDRRQGVGLGGDRLPEIAWCEVPGGRAGSSFPNPSAVTGLLDEAVREKAGCLPGGHVLESADKSRVWVRLPPFDIARYPVTWRQFQAFGDAEDYRDERWWRDLGPAGELPERRSLFHDNDPVTSVTWWEAVAFCRWLGGHSGGEVRLPSVWEWELAASAGDRARRYACGEEWDPMRANTIENGLGRPTAVGMYPAGASPVGVLDLCGNVWEWCLGAAESGLVTMAEDVDRAIRGGSWNHVHENAETGFHNEDPPSARYFDLGFRLVRT